MEHLAATFGSEEVCTNPLLGLTHLRNLGEDYLLVCPTLVKSWDERASESSCVPPPLDK